MTQSSSLITLRIELRCDDSSALSGLLRSITEVCDACIGLAIAEDDCELDLSLDSRLASCKLARELKFDGIFSEGNCVAMLDARSINSSSWKEDYSNGIQKLNTSHISVAITLDSKNRTSIQIKLTWHKAICNL